MNQLTQKLKNGKMQILEVAIPTVLKGHVLVRNHYSLISAGTEASTVAAARKGYIGKAKDRPQQAKQVLGALKQQGPIQTYRAVMKKLDTHSPIGYSCAGEVVGTAPDVTEFKIGDLVACGGLTACHAEAVSVPVNLVVKLPNDTDLKQAAYNTLGSIAMQGVRQADLRIGETCAVIGLGLVGQLTTLLLKASGIRTIGIDIDETIVKMASKYNVDIALQRNAAGIEDTIMGFTRGLGCDGVIITAASSSLDPINFAGTIARKKGTIVVVGNIPTGFDREPHFYKKELQVKMSCSYGPGRYDPIYEEKGIDYPAPYVRWTEKRNMQAFQDLIYSKKIDVGHLITHTFKLEDAPTAYDMILAKSEPFLGILIEYDVEKPIKREKIIVKPQASRLKPQAVSIGFIGAGSYAQSHLLPNIPKKNGVSLKGVMTTTGTSSRSVAERFGFEFCTSNEKDILENDEINTVFIATRHDSHAEYVIKALKAGKNVFVEKPLCINLDELGQIVELLNSINSSKDTSEYPSQTVKQLTNQLFNKSTNEQFNQSPNQPILMVGYNRRFSPLIRTIKEKFKKGPMAMIYRVNAGNIPPDSWIQDAEIGGGRIIGEVCHFVDLLTFLNGSLPISIYADALNDPNHLNDTLNVSLSYQNGSIGTISYFANGDNALPKERLEVFSHGAVAVLDDYRSLKFYAKDKRKHNRLVSQNKGQKNEVNIFIQSINKGTGVPTPLEDIFNTSLVTFKIIESLQTNERLSI